MKRLAINALTALVGIVASSIVTAWITGQPLAGLTKLKGLYQTFIQSSVPAWAFALAFLVSLSGIYYAITHLPKCRPKGKVHFVPDAHKSGWSKHSDTDMDVGIGGTFTYGGPGELIVLQAYLKGTQLTTVMMAEIEAPDGSRNMVPTSELWLRAGFSQRTFLHLILKPLLGTPGKPLRRQLVLRDKYNRDFLIGPIEFPYIGR